MVHTCYEVMQLFKFLVPTKHTVSLFFRSAIHQEKVRKVIALNSAKKEVTTVRNHLFLCLSKMMLRFDKRIS
jgi:hypothetical protein